MKRTSEQAQLEKNDNEKKPKSDPQSQYWMFTINNYPEDINIESLCSEKDYCIAQYEIGEQGTKHIQGYICFEKKKRFSQVKKLFKDKFNVMVHIEMRKGTHQQAKDYCSKEDTRDPNGKLIEIGDDSKYQKNMQGKRTDLVEVKSSIDKNKGDTREIWDSNFSQMVFYSKNLEAYGNIVKKENIIKDLKNEFEDAKLHQWQEKVLELLNNQDKRKLLWIYDDKGNSGKTWLAKYLVVKQNAFYCRGGKIQDVAHAYKGEELIVFDFTRDSKDYIVYNTLESMKDNMIWSPKYDSHLKLSKNNKVIILANFLPQVNKVSLDRWQILELFGDSQEELLTLELDVQTLKQQQDEKSCEEINKKINN